MFRTKEKDLGTPQPAPARTMASRVRRVAWRGWVCCASGAGMPSGSPTHGNAAFDAATAAASVAVIGNARRQSGRYTRRPTSTGDDASPALPTGLTAGG